MHTVSLQEKDIMYNFPQRYLSLFSYGTYPYQIESIKQNANKIPEVIYLFSQTIASQG